MSDFASKLRRLGVVKGARELAGAPKPASQRVYDQALPPGHEAETPYGGCFFIEERYPLEQLHGRWPLGALREHDRAAAGQMIAAQDGAFPPAEPVDLTRALFVDTETTGLGQGTGVLAFLIGAGYFDGDAFVLRQYFMRDPSEEPGALYHLGEWSAGFGGLVSFNGRGFDVPIMANRFVLARLRPGILRTAHLDLLPPARRVWRGRFESCALGALERHVLGVQRRQDDILSWLIPDLYRQYLRGGDNGEMRQVLYHNAVDILSLVVLAARLCRLFADPLAEDADPRERVAMAHWFGALGLAERAEQVYNAALGGWLPLEEQHACLQHLAGLFKQQERRAEAVPLWIQWAMQDEGSVEAHVELAKFYEWHEVALDKALAWTEQGLAIAARWPADARRQQAEEELQHRRARLKHKLERKRGPSA